MPNGLQMPYMEPLVLVLLRLISFRLHNVKQLGLAHLVYPDLNYSRFAHSLGACHVVSRMIRAINLNCPHKQLPENDHQLYRLAALLHDLGHYPFSHAMEHVVEEYYKRTSYLTAGRAQKIEQIDGNTLGDTTERAYFSHEALGRHIIDEDGELHAVLKKHSISREELKAAVSREQPGKLVSLVSSDLDCDRIDYLMRTARHSGLPYGSVDIEYIIGQMCVDSNNHVCLTKKALRAADHLIVSRYFDYTQVVFHKTVVAFEEVLKKIICELLERGQLDCSSTMIQKKINDGEFANFDDQFIIGKFRKILSDLNASSDSSLKTKIEAVLYRRPPKIVGRLERIRGRESQYRSEHRNLVRQIKEKINGWANRLNIPEDLWYVWEKYLPMTKIGSLVPISDIEKSVEEETAQGIHILTTDPSDINSKSRLLVDYEHALSQKLSLSNLYMIRVYVHLSESENDAKRKQREIKQMIRDDLSDFPFSE
ncbi:HD domain-containing protein [Betaproteobacteria bacterium PRO4]|nr:HD domain-containing protein [Betaproteobacteria bacterium PRO4]